MTLHRGANVLTYETMWAVELDNATLVALTFTTQKNGVKGEVICNGMSGDPLSHASGSLMPTVPQTVQEST